MGATCNSTKDSSKKNGSNYTQSQNSDKASNGVPINPNTLPGAATIALEKIKEKYKDSDNYIKNLNHETKIMKIGDVRGSQLILESCNESTIIVLDYSAQVTIEKCKNCNIFIGPCKSK
jgi:hypothetical protein